MLHTRFAVIDAYLRLSAILLCASISAILISGAVAAAQAYVPYANQLVTSPPKGASFSASLEQLLLAAANAYRQSKGYPPLKPASAETRLAARAHAMDMLVQGKVGHVAKTGHSFESRMRALRDGAMILPAMGENAARSTRQALSDAEIASYIMRQWIKSPAHNHTLVSRDYLTVATGVARRGEDIYAVQIFVGPEVKTNLNLPQ